WGTWEEFNLEYRDGGRWSKWTFRPSDSQGLIDVRPILTQSRQPFVGFARGDQVVLSDRGAVDAAPPYASRWPERATGFQLEFMSHPEPVCAVLSYDKSRLAVAHESGRVDLWRIDEFGLGSAGRTLTAPVQKVARVAISPDNRSVALAAGDALAVWTDLEGAPTLVSGHTGKVNAVAWSRQGHLLVSAGDDATIRFWDAATLELKRTLRGHAGAVVDLIFTPEQRTLVSAGADGELRSWDLLTGELKGRLCASSSSFTRLAISEDGTLLGAGTTDGKVLLFSAASPSEDLEIKVRRITDEVAGREPEDRLLESGGVTPDTPDRRAAAWLNRRKLWYRRRKLLDGSALDDPGEVELAEEFRIFWIQPLDGENVSDEDLKQLSGLVALPSLSLMKTPVTSAGISHLTGLPRLNFLNLSGTAIDDRGLASLADAPRLDTLYLADTQVGDHAIGTLGEPTRLKRLSLANSALTDAGLAQLAKFHGLTDLDLRGTAVGEPGLGALTKLPALKSLYLDGTQATSGVLPRLESAGLLEELDLSGCPVTNELIGQWPVLRRLHGLWLSRTPLGDEGLLALSEKCPSLRFVAVDETSISLAGLSRYVKSHPDVQVRCSPGLGAGDPSQELVLLGVSYPDGGGRRDQEAMSPDELRWHESPLRHRPGQFRYTTRFQIDHRDVAARDAIDAVQMGGTVTGLLESVMPLSNDVFDRLTALPEFTTLGARFGDQAIAKLGRLKSLQELRIHKNDEHGEQFQLTTAGFLQLPVLEHLRVVSLNNLNLTEEILPALTRLPSLERLEVRQKETRLTPSGIARALPQLRQLMIADDRLSDIDVAPLADLKALESLSLDSKRITDRAVDFLEKAPQLKKLNLRKTKARDRQLWKTRLPNCDIEFGK
ncbi:MAG: hypothetical protein ACKV0T_20930, partial [Planctomycetales bacterium]